MPERSQIQYQLVNIASGGRLLRVFEAVSGLALEKLLDPQQPVLRQKERLLKVFEAALARAEMLSVA